MSEQLFASAGLTIGQVNAIVKKLGGEQGAMQFLRGYSEITVVKHVIDMDAKPLIPYDGWKVEEHKKGGQLEWTPTGFRLHLSANQAEHKSIEGYKLRKELANEPVLNANLLDYLLEHPHLIPEDWKVDEQGRTRYIYFWGTIYRVSDVNLSVRYLHWNGGHWKAWYNWFNDVFGVQSPSLLLAR